MAQRKIAPFDFECEAAYAPSVYNAEGSPRVLKKDELTAILQQVGIPATMDLPTVGIPVALRWRTSQNLGFPLEPFRVWRKSKKTGLPTIPVQTFTQFDRVIFNNGPFYRLFVTIKNDSSTNRIYSIYPLDPTHKQSGSKQFTINIAAGASSSLLIDHPNTAGLYFGGAGFRLEAVAGITMAAYVNDPDWQLIQVVGLPFNKSTIDPDLYSPEEQGYVNGLTEPETASKQRVDLYRFFYKDPPSVASDGTLLPPWKIPTGTDLLKAYQQTVPINNGRTGTLYDINEMLHQVYQVAPSLNAGQQQSYIKTIQSLGVVDPANPNPQPNGTYQYPVCSATLLSVASDCWHALGLGFGTTDFLPVQAGQSFASVATLGGLQAFDYMITATFNEPVLAYDFSLPVRILPKFKEFRKQEYAALCHFDIQQPPPPAALLAETTGQNRPLVRDDYFYESVRVSWASSPVELRSPLSYAIAFRSNLSGQAGVRFLNINRPFLPGQPQAYVPALRADSAVQDLPGRDSQSFNRFYHDRSSVPFNGVVTQQYYVATQNVFGLWSSWVVANHALVAKEPQIPTIVSARFITRHKDLTNHVYPADLEIIIQYDFDDRTPFEIQLAGYFVMPLVPEPPVVVSSIVHSNSGGSGTRYRIRFSGATPQLYKLNAANVLEPVGPNEGRVTPETSYTADSSAGSMAPASTDSRAYRVVLYKMEVNFLALTRLYYTLYCRAAEATNPTRFSVFSNEIIPGTNPPLKGRSTVISVLDPLPRMPPSFAPDIKWASLPDATNTSRYHLKFTPVPGAVGYAVYMATELSLRDRLTGVTEYPTDGTIYQRRNVLNGASVADRDRAIDAFTRISKQLLSAPQTELAMNGDTDGLYIYAVSSFTDQQAESRLSNWIYVAIPERITPQPPTLTGFVQKTPMPVFVLRVKVGVGNTTDTVELFCTTKKYLSSDINLMGLPTRVDPAITWQRFTTVNGLEQPVADPSSPFDYYKIELAITPGWAPIYYRAVALGLNKPGDGKMPGRSPSSNLLELQPTVPTIPPSLTSLLLVPNVELTQLRLSFQTNAYVGRSPHGNHQIILYRQNSSKFWDKVVESDIPDLRKNRSEPELMEQLIRLSGIVNGVSTYAYTMPYEEKIMLKIAIIDPLGRKTEQVVSYQKPEYQIYIKDLTIQRQLTTIRVGFKTTVSKRKPLVGEFVLAIRVRRNLTVKTVASTPMQSIPDIVTSISPIIVFAGGTSRDLQGYYTYLVQFQGASQLSAFSGATGLVIRITDPNGISVDKELII